MWAYARVTTSAFRDGLMFCTLAGIANYSEGHNDPIQKIEWDVTPLSSEEEYLWVISPTGHISWNDVGFNQIARIISKAKAFAVKGSRAVDAAIAFQLDKVCDWDG